MSNKVEISVGIHGNNNVPSYVVCYDMGKDDLYDLMKVLFESKAFIIPVYTKKVNDVPDFSDALELENNEYLITPFYAGSNLEVVEGYLTKIVDVLSYDDY